MARATRRKCCFLVARNQETSRAASSCDGALLAGARHRPSHCFVAARLRRKFDGVNRSAGTLAFEIGFAQAARGLQMPFSNRPLSERPVKEMQLSLGYAAICHHPSEDLDAHRLVQATLG